jgi:hypothetical protein
MLLRIIDDPTVIISSIPIASRRDVANAFERTLKGVNMASHSIEAHTRLLLFAPYVLATKVNRKHKQSFITSNRAKRFSNASLEEIFNTIISESKRIDIPMDGAERQIKSSIKNVKRLISLGRPGDAIRQLNSNGVHRTTPEIVTILRDLHPTADSLVPEHPSPQFISFTIEQVSSVLASFPKGSAAGPFALSADALTAMSLDPQLGQTILEGLAVFSANFISGSFPSDVSPFYGSARLIPLVKKNYGVRPMAVGDTFRRLSCKLALLLVNSEFSSFFQPTQFGVGCPNGTDSIIHSIASTMEHLKDDECILQVDFSNAFNLVDRLTFIRLVKTYFPQLANIVNYLYLSHGYLCLGPGLHIRSMIGVQQGCPLAPFLFALVLSELLKDLDFSQQLKLNMWYLDDGHLVGKIPVILEILKAIDLQGPIYGIYLNMAKCIVYITPETSLDIFDPLLGLKIVNDGIVVLGSPIGSVEFVRDYVREKIKAAVNIMESAAALQDPQSELLLLRCCTGAPKMVYWLRTCISEVIREPIFEFDIEVDKTLQRILGTPIYDHDRMLMHLPLSLGGLGIAKASLSADAAFVSSMCTTWRLQQCEYPRAGYIESSQILYSSGIELPTLVPKNINFMNLNPLITFNKDFVQKKLMLIINENIRTNLFNNFDMRRKTIVTGRACHGASYWLTNPPCWEDYSMIDAASFRLLIKFSLGMPILQKSQPCPDCGTVMDIFGDHAVTCRTAGGLLTNITQLLKA